MSHVESSRDLACEIAPGKHSTFTQDHKIVRQICIKLLLVQSLISSYTPAVSTAQDLSISMYRDVWELSRRKLWGQEYFPHELSSIVLPYASVLSV
jgi:hypothetical protein